MKNMTLKVAVIAFFTIVIGQLVFSVILGVAWAVLDEHYAKIENNSFLRKVYCWLDNLDDHKFSLLIVQFTIIATALSVLSFIF